MLISSHRSVSSLLVIDAGYFLTREVVRALKTDGHNVVVVSMRMDPSKPVLDQDIYSSFLRDILDAYQHAQPDALLTINHLGFDEDGRLNEMLETLELPALVWYVDSPRYIFLDKTAKYGYPHYCLVYHASYWLHVHKPVENSSRYANHRKD